MSLVAALEKEIKNIAVLLAAGEGRDGEFNGPKQLVRLAGKTILEHSMAAFQENARIDEIIVVTNDHCRPVVEKIVISGGFSKVRKVLLGGTSRAESSCIAIESVRQRADQHAIRLIFHDAIRPLLSQRVINDVVNALGAYNAVGTAISTVDTVVRTDLVSSLLREIPDRRDLRSSQTPQAFSFDVIRKAYALAMADSQKILIDDCDVVHKYLPEEPIRMVEGDPANLKLERRSDLQILDKFLQLRSFEQVSSTPGSSLELSRLKDKVLVVIGGTSGIGHEIISLAQAYQAKAVRASRRTGFDVRSIDSARDLFQDVVNQYGRIDIVINTAGILVRQPLVDMDIHDVYETMDVNYRGTVNVAIAAFPHLKASRGCILNFTSSSYTYGRALYSIYSSSKAAIVNLTQALADEWLVHSIRVNCINPERTATPMRRAAFGIEPPETLLRSESVALKTLLVACGGGTGQIVDIKQ